MKIGTRAVDAKTACVACADGFAGTGGECVICDDGGQQSSPDSKSCVCNPGTYDSWCSIEAAREAIGSGAACNATQDNPTPLHVFVWTMGRTWTAGTDFRGDDINHKWAPSSPNPRCMA